MSECECLVDVHYDGVGLDAKVERTEIRYCPMHEAAERMLTALDGVRAHLARQWGHVTDCGKADCPSKYCEGARQLVAVEDAISVARGGFDVVRAAKGEQDER